MKKNSSVSNYDHPESSKGDLTMRATQTNSKPDPTDRLHILLMEDEAIVARGYQMALIEEGYGVDWAATGQAALDAIDRNGCDLLVADLRLPDMDGMQVIDRVKQTRPEIGIIVVTGYAEVASAVQALKAGVHDYLCKPLTEQAFIEAVAQALPQKQKDPPVGDRSHGVPAARENVIRKNEVVRALKVCLSDNRLPAPGRSDVPLPDDRINTPEDAAATPVSVGATVDASLDRQLLLEKNLIENAVEGIMAWESNGTITVFNKRMQAMLGYTREETIGRMSFDRFFPVGAAEHFKRDMYDGRSGRANTLLLPETDMLDKTGTLVPVQLSATVLFENRREIGIVVFARDLKDFREIEQVISDLPKLLHQNKMVSLGRLAASIVHEINNPLSGILNYVRMMLKSLRRSGGAPSPQDAEKFLRYLTLVEGEVGRCAGIVANLLAFSRKSKMEYGAVNLPDLLHKCLLLSQHKLDMENIRSEIQVDAVVPEVLGDFNQIQQCVINLIFNAIDAMDKGGILWLGCRHHAGRQEVELYVRDNGCGIAKENLLNIFDPFFTTKEEGRGLGLGLSTVYKIIAQHKGTIDVESQLGRGTVFTIRLPALKTAEGLYCRPSDGVRSA
jgi:two-component system, NtrC family, sensor kinase